MRALTYAVVLSGIGAMTQAQESPITTGYTIHGTPGMVTLPTASMAPDAEATFTISSFKGANSAAMTFQLSNRVTGSFRYTGIDGAINPAQGQATYYDRSFDLRYQVIRERKWLPSVAVGLQDFVGTGLYAGEYIVATKHLTPAFSITGGLGFGRLGSHNTLFTIGDRPDGFLARGGVPNIDQWFRGDVAPFAGAVWQINKRARATIEYSSDAYTEEEAAGFFTHRSPLNFAFDYDLGRQSQVSLFSLNNDKIGVQLTFSINPRFPTIKGGKETSPLPIAPRAPGTTDVLGWASLGAPVENAVRERLSAALERDNLVLEGLDLSAREATLRLVNPRYGAEPQALGRAARSMANMLPPSIETLHIVTTAGGIGISRVTFQRRDLERLQFASSRAIQEQMIVEDAIGHVPKVTEGLYPKFTFGFTPYVQPGYFDVHKPVRLDLGIRARTEVFLTPNVKIYGTITKRIVGNLADADPDFGGVVPPVRTLAPLYFREGDPGIESLALYHFARPGKNLYSRIAIGLLENMYGGVAGELLWKPVDSRFALGGELAYVKQRDFNRLFDFRDYEILTGHVSGYYDFGNGINARVDVGRYLAGDKGATFTIARKFNNGWSFGAFATLTNISADDFGEGSFDKGVLFTIPVSFPLLKPSRTGFTTLIRPLQRNGGARLNVRESLYGQVSDYHRPTFDDEYGRFWR